MQNVKSPEYEKTKDDLRKRKIIYIQYLNTKIKHVVKEEISIKKLNG